MARYEKDVLAAGWQKSHLKPSKDTPMQIGMVVETVDGFCGAIVRWENGLVVLEDRHLKQRAFPIGPGFLLEGQPVHLRIPPRTGKANQYTASGSRKTKPEPAKTALPSRIYVEGRHDAQLVEKVWGDDLRHVGVVVEYLGGIDDLVSIVANFKPEKGRRLGVLVDHLVAGTKESRIRAEVVKGGYGNHVMITGHEFIDIWQAIRPESVGIKKWPEIPRDVDFKKGTCAALGWPYQDQTDIARVWQALLSKVKTWKDLDFKLVQQVEQLIDFVTQDHLDTFEA